MSNTSNKTTMTVAFAATNPYIASNIVMPTESSGKNDIVNWGEGNKYPEYLLSLYNNVPTLRSVVNGNIDFITGDDAHIQPLPSTAYDADVINKAGDTIREQIKDIAKDFEIYGGFALQVIRNLGGEVVEVYYLDMRYLRTNKECNKFYYCENWTKAGRKATTLYETFIPNLNWSALTEEQKQSQLVTVLFVKNVHTQVYPAPVYAASVKACEIERGIDDFHINALENGFTSSAIVNFNNGVPTDEEKEEIEETFNERFSGHENAGRIIFSWNKSKDTATTIEEFKVEDFGERYKSLAAHSRQQIFTAFRANPNLFGIPTEGNGFSNEEYAESFKLYNRTQIKPIQRLIADAYDKIYGMHGVLTIIPFSLEGADTNVK